MGQVQNSMVISAPVDQVFAVHKSIAKLMSFVADNVDIEMVSLVEELNKGEEIELFLGRFGINRRCKIKIEELIPSEKIEIKQTLGLFNSYRHTVRFSDHGGGKTLLTDFVSYKLPFGLLGYLIDDLFFPNDLMKILEGRYKKINSYFAALNSQQAQ
ncbi:MAG: SRPBCC family protein [Pseudomonadota bacterium]|nr:SRPBCC family protein [Pseudomonadota bacterium]